MKELQGTWTITALEVEGTKMPAAGTIVVKGKRFTSLSMGSTYEGKLHFPAPNQIDMVFTAGPEKGNINYGIFEVAGDTWRLCLNMHGKTRPTKFATKSGSGLALETLTRGVLKKPASPKTKMMFVPSPELSGEWQMMECITSGEPLDAEYLKHGRRVARGNDMVVTMMGRTMLKAKYTVDRKTKPMSIDYLLPDGRTRLGIYSLAGNVLTNIFAAPGDARPTKLKSVRGDQCTFTVWKRVG